MTTRIMGVPGRCSWGLLRVFMGDGMEDSMACIMDFLIEAAVYVVIWIIVSVIFIIAISWTHKW